MLPYPMSALSKHEVLQRRLVQERFDIRRICLYLPEQPPEVSLVFGGYFQERDFANIWRSVTQMASLRSLESVSSYLALLIV